MCKKIVSVELDGNYFESLEKKINRLDIKNVDLIFEWELQWFRKNRYYDYIFIDGGDRAKHFVDFFKFAKKAVILHDTQKYRLGDTKPPDITISEFGFNRYLKVNTSIWLKK